MMRAVRHGAGISGAGQIGACLAGACLVALATMGPAAAQSMASRGWGAKGREQEKQKQYVPGAKAQEKMFPLDSTWTVVSVNGKTFPGGERPSFIIDKQYRARGFGGCNTFVATAFPLKEQHLAVGPLALSKRQCDKGLAASEQAFLMALRTSGAWDIVGSQLVIKSQTGELKFERAL
jgi:heat shock protein HslJ